jgi:hypothetical protein
MSYGGEKGPSQPLPSAGSGWVDQRMRWIEPCGKGPDLAAVIERTYKLKP